MAVMTKDSVCPVCEEQGMQPFLNVQDVPVHCNLLWHERQAALDAPRGRIHLAFCPHCGHIANVAFDPALMVYTQAYENSLHFSPRFQAYAEKLATQLVERHELRNKELVELGAGQGDFLRALCLLGDNRGWGFDAAYVPDEQAGEDARVTFVRDFDWRSHLDRAPDMIYARHVLEHIDQPVAFMQDIRAGLADRADALVFLEVPNTSYTLRELAIWDIIYEHCGYFTTPSLTCLLNRTGFQVLAASETYAGQFLTIEAVPVPTGESVACGGLVDLQTTRRRVATFTHEFQEKVSYWRDMLMSWSQAGRRTVVWGAGSKGTTFLNVLQAQELITYIVDINPRKRGKFVVGTGQEIVDPAFLESYRPDVVILMNPIYIDEIRSMLGEMGLAPDIAIA